MPRHFASDLIGRKWVNGARGPTEFDCWGLLAYVEATYFNTQLPAFPNLDAKDETQVQSLVDKTLAAGEWIKIDQPVNGCAVAMGAALKMTHVGVYLTEGYGMVLHCMENGGVICQRITTMSNYGLNVLGFYIPKSWSQPS